MIDLKKKETWYHYVIIVSAIVLISPVIQNFLAGIFNLGEVWVQFTSLLITIVGADLISHKILKI